jgi:hypothetical protein
VTYFHFPVLFLERICSVCFMTHDVKRRETTIPDDLTEQRYRDNATECVERARTADSESIRAAFLNLAQKWLEMASDRFGLIQRPPDEAVGRFSWGATLAPSIYAPRLWF